MDRGTHMTYIQGTREIEFLRYVPFQYSDHGFEEHQGAKKKPHL